MVKKFGGTSLSDIAKIEQVASRISQERKRGEGVVVVVSAMGDTTDDLLTLAKRLMPSPPEREIDMLISTGEQVSASLLSIALNAIGCQAISLTASQAGIRTDGVYTRARITGIDTTRLRKEIDSGKVVVVTGFQGISEDEDITTLGRGGSDLSAVALAVVLGADVCEIYTDVDGIYTADPNIVPNPRRLDYVSYDEMLEMASAGAKVLQPRAVEFAKRYGSRIHVRSSLTRSRGTMVIEEVKCMEKMLVSGVAGDENQAKITILSVPDRPGIAAKIFRALAAEGINVDMIIQSAGEQGRNDISFTVARDDLKRSLRSLGDVAKELGSRGVVSDDGVAKVSIVGIGMRTHPGVAAKMFETLASGRINIEMISTSEIKISCIVRREELHKAMRLLHDAFGLGKKRKGR